MLHTACSGFNQRCFARQALKALSPRLRLGLQHLSQGPSDRRPLFSALLRMTGPKRSSQLLPEASGNGDAQATKQGKSGDRDIAVELLDFINEAWTQYHAVGPSCRSLGTTCLLTFRNRHSFLAVPSSTFGPRLWCVVLHVQKDHCIQAFMDAKLDTSLTS